MVNISVIGTGYVGLVTGACFAENGNKVVCIDIDKEKINSLKSGVVPIYEPGLNSLVKRNLAAGKLKFTDDIKEVNNSLVIFLAVGTPSNEDGSTNLNYILEAARYIGRVINSYKIIVDKSTIPPGTASKVRNEIKKELDKRNLVINFDVVSNPEFLVEGDAVRDATSPNRIVIGSDSEKAKSIMQELYRPETLNDAPIIITDIVSAEVAKYASNFMLASRISIINSIAGICEKYGADVTQVSRIMMKDPRIGNKYLYAGSGYGGSCFKKDTKAMISFAKEKDCDTSIFEAVENLNEKQKTILIPKLINYFRSIKDKTFAVWGLAFKKDTDDMRESPAMTLISCLLEKKAKVRVYDPQAMENAKKIFGDKINYGSQYEILNGADALIIITDWNVFKQPNFNKIKSLLKKPTIFDGKNLYNLETIKREGFDYISVGRPSIIN